METKTVVEFNEKELDLARVALSTYATAFAETKAEEAEAEQLADRLY